MVPKGLEHFGADGTRYDQRITLVLPGGSEMLPSFEGADDSWFESWLDTRLVVGFVGPR